jgi:hypothetical protein
MQWYQWSAAVLAIVGLFLNLEFAFTSHSHMHNRFSLNLWYIVLLWMPQVWMIGDTVLRWWFKQ